MQFKVQGKEQELKFGIGFVRKLDKKYFVVKNGLEFGLGLHLAYPGLLTRNITALSDVIRCALPGQLSEAIVDKAVEDYADENEGLGTLFDEVVEGLKMSNSLKDTMNAIQEEAQETKK